MSLLKVTIDGQTAMDGDLGEWSSNPPSLVTEVLKNNITPKPWMRCLMLVIAEAGMTGKDTTVDVTTSDNGWTINVGH